MYEETIKRLESELKKAKEKVQEIQDSLDFVKEKAAKGERI